MLKRNRKDLIPIQLAIGFLVFIATASAAAVSSCKSGCVTPNQVTKFSYKNGQSYTYNLDSNVQIYLGGFGGTAQSHEQNQTSIQVQGSVQLFSNNNCDYTLKIQKLTVIGPDGKKSNFGNEISKPVQFQMSNDEVNTEICSDGDDTEFSLNIKRSIISLFQSADESKSFETDVFGVCPTTFSAYDSNGVKVVNKVRNLNLCGYREILRNGFITATPINQDNNNYIKSVPVLKGDYILEQRIKNGVLDSAELVEDYSFVPFAAGTVGPKSKVTTKIQLSGEGAAAAPKLPKSQKSVSILFVNPKPESATNLNTLKNVIKELLKEYANNVGPKAATQFTELIRLMRSTKRDDLLALYQQIKAGTVGDNRQLTRKIFFDALFRVGTGESVEVITNLSKSRELNESEQKLVYLSLTLVNHMTKEALSAVAKLLDANAPNSAYLHIGTLVAKYCASENCENADVKAIFDKFLSKMNNCRSQNRSEEDTVVAVLKGIRNTNNLINQALDKVLQCSTEKFPTRIRVNALKAFSAAACNKKLQNSALQTLKNVNEDSEVRIEAYLALMKCPTATLANNIKELLDNEQIYQVGSYITSHLANLRSSTDPSRYNLRHFFENVGTSRARRFPTDFRRYSFNHEYSYSVGGFGFSASSDSNVIYSQKSFLPRSTSFNLTGELFGKAFNFFEVQGRQENLDTYVEHYFGPKGVFQSSNPAELINLLGQKFQKLSSYAKEQIRTRRGVREEVNSFNSANDNNFANANDVVFPDYSLDLSFKFYGSELYFLSLGGKESSITPEGFINKFFETFNKGLDTLKDFNQVYENHVLFLDSDIYYPTGIGFPLKLVAQGAGVVRLETKGQIDVMEMLKNFKNSQFQLNVIPSANFEVTGTLSVDGFAVETGIQIAGAGHTSTGAEFKFALSENGRGLDIQLGLPLEKQELFSFENKIVYVTRERGYESVETPIKQNVKGGGNKFNECFDQIYPYAGITFCAGFQLATATPSLATAPSFLLNGPNKVSLWLEVDKKYHFRIFYDDKNPKHQSLLLSFDTPGSQQNRATSLKLEAFAERDLYVRATLLSPIRNANIEAGFKSDETEVVVYAKAASGREVEYMAKFGFRKNSQQGGPTQDYTPIAVLKTGANSKEDKIAGYKLDGTITVDRSSPSGTKVIFKNVQLISPANVPITLTGELMQAGASLNVDVAVSKEGSKGQLRGDVNFSPENFKVDMELLTNVNGKTDAKLLIEFQNAEGLVHYNVLLGYGRDIKNLDVVYSVKEKAEYEIELIGGSETEAPKKMFKSLKTESAVNIPILEVTCNTNFQKDNYNYDFKGVFNKKSTLASSLALKFNGRTQGDVDTKFTFTVNKYDVKMNAERVIDNGKSRIRGKLSLGPTQMEVSGVVGHKFNSQEADVNLEATIVLNNEPHKFNVVIFVTPKNINTSAKILIDKKPYFTYDAKVVRAEPNSNGNFEVMLVDLFNGKGDFKVQGGRGDANFLLKFVKLDRKIKMNSKFNIAAPTYDITTDVFYNFEKDNTQKIHMQTKNKLTKSLVDSKNNLDISGVKFELNVNGEKIGPINDGIIKGLFNLVWANSRKMSGEFTREIHVKKGKTPGVSTPTTTGSFDFKFTDRLQNDKERKIEYNAKLNGADMPKRIIDVLYTFVYTDLENKVTKVTAEIKNLPKGEHSKTALVNINFNDNIVLNKNGEFSFNVEEYTDRMAVYHHTGKYDGSFDYDIKGKYNIGERGTPSACEMRSFVTVQKSPEDKKQYKFETNSKYMLSQGDNPVFDGVFNILLGSNTQQVSLNTKANGNLNSGSGGLKITLPQRTPITTDVSYTFSNVNNESTKATGAFKVQYDTDKSVEFNGKMETQGYTDVSLFAELKSPLNNANKIDLTFKHSSKVPAQHYTSSVHVNVDDKKFAVDSDVILAEKNPSFDFTIVYPNPENKVIKLYGKMQQFGDRKFKTEMIIQNLGNFNLNTDLEMSYENAESFSVKSNIDSENLKLNKIYLEVQSKAGSGGKGVEFKATSDKENVLSGSADFTLKEEKGKTIVEGQGNVKLFEKSKAASFKFIRHNFDQAKGDSETGVLYVLNGLIGPRNIVTEIKMTDKNFHIKHTMCEEKKRCINFEFLSLFKRIDINVFEHELLISMDLRQLGYTHEFGLKALTSRQNIQFDHTVDMHFHSQDKSKYQYSVYIHPKSAGVILTLPTRVVALEGQFKYPDPGQSRLVGDYDASIVLYLDKANKPNHKGEIGLSGSIKKRDSDDPTFKPSYVGNGEFRFQHPTIKPFVVSGKFDVNGPDHSVGGELVLDIFQNANQKIVANAKYRNDIKLDPEVYGFNSTAEANIKSKGLKFDMGYDGHAGFSLANRQFSFGNNLRLPIDDFNFGTYLFMSTEEFQLFVKYFNENVIETTAEYNIPQHTASIKSTLKTFGSKAPPAYFNGKVNDLTSAEFELTQDKMYNIKGELKLGKVASIVVKDNAVNKDILVGRVQFDQALSTDFNVDDQLMKNFVEKLRASGQDNRQAVTDALKQKFEAAKAKFMINTNEVAPNFNEFYVDYKTELTAIGNELLSDTSIKEIIEYLNKIYLVVMANITEISNILYNSVNQASAIIVTFYNDTLNSITPFVTQFFEMVNAHLSNLYNEMVRLFTYVFERIVKTMKLYEDDFKKISKSVYDISKKTFQDVNKYVEGIIKELTDIYKLVLSYIESVPGVSELKQRLDEMISTFMVPEYILSVVQEFITYVKEIFPKGEVHEFADALIEYINNKAMKVEVNDVEQIKDLFVKFVKAVRSVLAPLIRKQPHEEEYIVTRFLSYLPFSGFFKRMMPLYQQVLPNFRLSTFNFLRNERLISIRDILYQYRPYGFQMNEAIPPFTLHGYIADGIHIFTFDRRHLTFNGKCQYILAQDYVNKNFTIVANINENGGFKSITLMDKRDQIEVNDKGIVQLNGKNTELPTHNRDIHAWRDYNHFYLLSSYGAEIKCSVDLRLCQFTVSGYYLGKLHGLLGNGNNEPHDDFIASNGKLTDNYADFGNSYKTNGKTCAHTVVFENDHLHHHHTQHHDDHAHGHEDTAGNVCSDFFSGSSSLRYCFLLVDSTNYREACNHAVHLAGGNAAQQETNACNIAELYTSVCRGEGIPINAPSKCRTCTDNAGQKVSVDDQFSTKSPQGQADIVILLDTALTPAQMNDLVQPIIGDLRKELKARDITSVNIPIIGFNKDDVYISLFTSQGKLDYSGKVSSLSATTTSSKAEYTIPKYVRPTSTGCDFIDSLLQGSFNRSQTTREDYGLSTDARAFRYAMDYPFRSAASKTIIAIRSDALSNSKNPSKLALGNLANKEAHSRGIAVHAVTPIRELSITNAKDQKQVKNIIGFNSKLVLQTNDLKKKSNLGSTDMRANIKYDADDMGIEMVQSGNGYVFALQNFNNLKQTKDKRNFVTVMVNALADQISRTEIKSDCTCKLVSGLYPIERCEATETNILAPVKKGGARG